MLVTDEKTTEGGSVDNLLTTGQLSVERLRTLQVLFDRICTLALARLRELADMEISLSLDRVWTSTALETGVGDSEHVVVLCDIQGQLRQGCLALDRAAVYLMIECFLGATGNARPYEEKRAFTKFERVFVRAAVGGFLDAIHEAFNPAVDLRMTIDSVETGDVVDAFVLEDKPLLAARITFEAFERTGRLHVLLPQNVVAPIRSCVLERGEEEQQPTDGRWSEYMQARLQRTDVECTAVLDGGMITLADVAQLKTGQVLELQTDPDSLVTLRCNGKDLFRCELGQANGVFTVKVVEAVDDEEDFLNAVMGG